MYFLFQLCCVPKNAFFPQSWANCIIYSFSNINWIVPLVPWVLFLPILLCPRPAWVGWGLGFKLYFCQNVKKALSPTQTWAKYVQLPCFGRWRPRKTDPCDLYGCKLAESCIKNLKLTILFYFEGLLKKKKKNKKNQMTWFRSTVLDYL